MFLAANVSFIQTRRQLFYIFLFYDRPFLHVCNLVENLFSTLILGSVFNDYVVFYRDILCRDIISRNDRRSSFIKRKIAIYQQCFANLQKICHDDYAGLMNLLYIRIVYATKLLYPLCWNCNMKAKSFVKTISD